VLRQCGYAGLREHQLEHLALLERTLTYRHNVTAGTTPLAELLRFMVDEVITRHLLESDRRYYDNLPTRAPQR
jgi:hemerythrin